jgi:hypothetical protein
MREIGFSQSHADVSCGLMVKVHALLLMFYAGLLVSSYLCLLVPSHSCRAPPPTGEGNQAGIPEGGYEQNICPHISSLSSEKDYIAYHAVKTSTAIKWHPDKNTDKPDGEYFACDTKA